MKRGKEETLQLEDQNTLDVSVLPAGVYSIVIKHGDKTKARRFTKK